MAGSGDVRERELDATPMAADLGAVISQTAAPALGGLSREIGAPRLDVDSGEGRLDPGAGGDWAICCSGGGIRSASYCLGALQTLEQAGLVAKAKWILGVSGGSYIAASRALVAHNLSFSDGESPAYAPGSPEERNLRNNTHYLAPDAAVTFTGVMSLVLGAAVTFALVYAPLFALAHAWGWLLRWRGVLAPSPGDGLAASAPTWAVAAPAVAGTATCVLFAWWWYTLPRRCAAPVARRAAAAAANPERGPGSGDAAWVWWAALATVALAVALLAAPFADAWLFSLSRRGTLGAIVHFFGFGAAVSWSPGALAALMAAIAGVARFCQAGLAKWHVTTVARRVAAVASGPPVPAAATGTAGGQGAAGVSAGAPGAAAGGSPASPGLSARAGMWLRQQLLPWLGTALIVLALIAFALLWTGDGAKSGFTAARLWPVVAAALVALIVAWLTDANRTSMHDFYRWRLANAYAVTRRAVREQDPVERQRAAATLMSDLERNRHDGPELVICATANINAARETPRGQGGFCLTFDPALVALHREVGSTEPEPAGARMSDYEALMGRDHLTLFGLSAISGAAISPLMGAATRRAYRILFTAANLRLGVWMPHPRVVGEARKHVADEGGGDSWWARRPLLLLVWYRSARRLRARMDERHAAREARLWAHVLKLRSGHDAGKWRGALWYRALQPTLGMLWAEAAGRLSYRSTWMYVTDGGHYDNLGLVEALRRGAENVVVLDASGDNSGTWFTIGSAVALARADEGVEISLDPSTMAGDGQDGPLRAGEVVRPWACGTFTRQGDPAGLPRQGRIWVCKLGWWRQAPWDVRAYAARHPEYPSDGALEELYDGAEFEAYRELGAAAARDLLGAGTAARLPGHSG